MFKKILKLLVIILFIGFFAIFLKGFYYKEEIDLENKPKENVLQENNQEINNSITSNQEKPKEDILQNDSKDKNIKQQNNKNKEVKKEKSNISNKSATTNSNQLDKKTSTDNSSDKKNTSTPTNELSKCSDKDSEWISFVEQQRKNGKVIFNSMQEAINYGENALNYGYGYWYNNIKLTYRGKNCTRDYYNTYLYVPPKICIKNGEYNSKFNVKPAFNEKNIISVIDYLKSLGYDCGNKE